MRAIQSYLSYQDYIKDYIAGVQKRNAAFSMRALAKKAAISPAQLSLILSHTKELSSKHAAALARALSLRGEELEYFLLLVEWSAAEESSKKVLHKRLKTLRTQKALHDREMGADFNFLGWEHLFLLVLSEIHQKRRSLVASASDLLAIDAERIDEILDELVRHGLLTKKGEKLIRSEKRVAFSSTQNHIALKKMHRSYLKKSDAFLESHSPDRRYSVTEFCRVSRDSFPEAVRLTNEYLDELAALSGDDPAETEVLGVSLHLNRIAKSALD